MSTQVVRYSSSTITRTRVLNVYPGPHRTSSKGPLDLQQTRENMRQSWLRKTSRRQYRRALATTRRSPLSSAARRRRPLSLSSAAMLTTSMRCSVPALFQPQGKVRPRPGPSGGGLSVAAPYKLHGGNSTTRSLHAWNECTKREYAKDVLEPHHVVGARC